MFREKFAEFLQDEDGGYVIWGLLWFILYVGIGGLAVDITDAFRTQSTLQATADAAALAGILSPLDDETEVDAQAIIYATRNMSQNVHGTVLTSEDVQIGRWNFDERTFTLGDSNPNAVRAVTRRAATNQNPLATNFLRIAGFGSFDVSTEAIAAQGISSCEINGIIACGALDFNPETHFVNSICLEAEDRFWFRDNKTTFEQGTDDMAGVTVVAECGDDNKKCIGPGNQVTKNEDFLVAFGLADGGEGNYNVPVECNNAENVSSYIDAVLDLADPNDANNFLDFDDFLDEYNGGPIDYAGYHYLAPGTVIDSETGDITDYGGVPAYVPPAATLPTDPDGNANLATHTVYNLNCHTSGASAYTLPPGNYTNVAVIANCPITFSSSGVYTIQNSLIAARPLVQKGSTPAIDAPNGTEINMPGGCDGRNEFYAVGPVHFAANGEFGNVRFLVDGKVTYAGQANGPVGFSLETTDDFQVAAGGRGTTFGGCPDGPGLGAYKLRYALVH